MSVQKPVVLGRISGLFGVKGWVRIHSYTDPREAILAYPHWFIDGAGDWRAVSVAEGQRHGKSVIARFDGIEDRDAAAAFVNAQVAVEREALPETGQNEYYWSDLEGLKVVRQDGTVLGMVAYLLETGAHDVLVVRRENQEILIPFVAGAIVKDVDLAARTVSVDWDWD